MRELYIIGEFHPYYELYNPRLPEEFRRTLKNIVEMEESFLRRVKPDRVFVEYPESWGLKEELKYRAEFFRLEEERFDRKLSKQEAETIIRRGYGERMRFYNRIKKDFKLVFLEDKNEYIEAGKTLVEALKVGEEDPYSTREFQLGVRKRERKFYERVKNENFKRGVVICGSAHIVRGDDSKEWRKPRWVEELEKFLKVRIFLLNLQEAEEGVSRELIFE